MFVFVIVYKIFLITNMVSSCVAYGCTNVADSRIPISYHTFPFKRPDLLNLWITAIRRLDWYPSKSSKICSDHFLPSDYQDRLGYKYRRLKSEAVPSIFSFTKHLLEKISPERELKSDLISKQYMVDSFPATEFIKIEVDFESTEEIHNSPTTSTSEPQQFEDKGIQTVVANEETSDKATQTVAKDMISDRDKGTQTIISDHRTSNQCHKLARQVKTLRQKLRRRDLNMSKLKCVIKELTKSCNSSVSLETVLENYFHGKNCESVEIEII